MLWIDSGSEDECDTQWSFVTISVYNGGIDETPYCLWNGGEINTVLE